MKYSIIIMLTFFLNSCTNTSFNQLSGDIKVNIESNLDAKITVGEQITGTGSESVLFWFIRLPGTRFRASGNVASMSNSSPASMSLPLVNSVNFLNIVENAKGEAIYDAINTSKADLIINPQYTIRENDYFFFKTVTCEVTGMKGTINKVQ